MCRQPRPPPDGQLYAGDDGWLDEIAYLVQTWLVHDHECVGAPPPPRTTSRVEGAHATLETMLRQSTGDLARVAHDVHALIHWQATEAAWAEAREAIRTPAEARSATVLAPAANGHPEFTMGDLLSVLVCPYTRVGLGIVRTMLDEATKACRPGNLPACTGYYARVLGLLCAHHVRLQIGARRPLPLALVGERWNLRMTRE
jgi:hypothetical protein